jgi:hypothetical protein
MGDRLGAHALFHYDIVKLDFLARKHAVFYRVFCIEYNELNYGDNIDS